MNAAKGLVTFVNKGVSPYHGNNIFFHVILNKMYCSNCFVSAKCTNSYVPHLYLKLGSVIAD